jgi:hypothetical protein
VYDLSQNAWYSQRELDWETSPPLTWGAAIATKWRSPGVQDEEQASTWLFGGENLIIFSDWTGGHPEQVRRRSHNE